MDRYLVQFRRHDQERFTTDCAFRDGQLDLAREYVRTVVRTLAQVTEGRIIDTQSCCPVYRHMHFPAPHSSREERIAAIFGKRQRSEDPNGSQGIDDDAFVKYEGPDDPEIRYR